MDSAYTPTLGLVGCGRWGKNLARNFASIGALRAICETDKIRRSELRDQYPDTSILPAFDEMLADDEIQQVAIAAPAVLHHSLAKQALLAGKDVYVEKPLCLKISDARELQELADSTSKILMVGHLLQYHPAVCKLQELVREGTLGRLYRITSNRLNLGKVRTEENAFWSLAPHDVSVILSLIGEEHPVSVQSFEEKYLQNEISDCATTRIHFSRGVNAQIQVSWLHPFKEQRLSVIGESAMAVFDDTEEWSRKLQIRRDYFSGGTPEYISLEQQEPLKNECLHFLQSCHDRTIPKSDAAEGVRVLSILDAATRSTKNSGESVSLNGKDM